MFLMNTHFSFPPVPDSSWTLASSMNPEVATVLHASGLSAENVDQKLLAIKENVFNKKILAQIEMIRPRIQRALTKFPYVANVLTQPVSLISRPQGSSTYGMILNLFRQMSCQRPTPSVELKNRFFRVSRGMSSVRKNKPPFLISSSLFPSHMVAERMFERVGSTLAEFFNRLQPRQHGPKRHEWEELDGMLASLESTWPAEVSSWRRTLQSSRDAEGVSAILDEWEKVSTQQFGGIVECVNLIEESVRVASKAAFAKYEGTAVKLINKSCSVCHGKNDFTTHEPFHETLLKCGRCKNIFYCSEACQRVDWPTHKIACVQR